MWISSTGNGGVYHPVTICQRLGYPTYTAFGGNCGATCSYCVPGHSCTNPGPETFDSSNSCPGSDAHGPTLCLTVMWLCGTGAVATPTNPIPGSAGH